MSIKRRRQTKYAWGEGKPHVAIVIGCIVIGLSLIYCLFFPPDFTWRPAPKAPVTVVSPAVAPVAPTAVAPAMTPSPAITIAPTNSLAPIIPAPPVAQPPGAESKLGDPVLQPK